MRKDLQLIRPDFLSPEDHRTMLDYALSCEDSCEPSLVGDNAKSPLRQSLTISDFGPCRQIIRDAVAPLVDEFSREFGISLGKKRQFDGSLVAHTDGAYYKPHVDLGGPDFHRSRAISAVYYFFRTPAAFTGGDLRIFRLDRPGEFVDIPARDNQLVVFPAMVPHEVRPVHCPSNDFADARFALNLWIHKVPDQEQQ